MIVKISQSIPVYSIFNSARQPTLRCASGLLHIGPKVSAFASAPEKARAGQEARMMEPDARAKYLNCVVASLGAIRKYDNVSSFMVFKCLIFGDLV